MVFGYKDFTMSESRAKSDTSRERQRVGLDGVISEDLKMLDGTHYFECGCGADEHTIRFTLDKDKEDSGIYASIYLSQYRSWWKRAWIGGEIRLWL